MQRLLATQFAALVFSLSMALPLTADDGATHSKRSVNDENAKTQTFADTPYVNAIAWGIKKDRPFNISLACRGRSYGYSVAPTPVYVPQLIVRPSVQAIAAPAPINHHHEVYLINPENDSIAYVLDGKRFDMHPGHSQKLTSRPAWIVKFHRGGQFGSARYTLTHGTYKFVATHHGWDLVKQDDTPTPPTPGLRIGNVARNR